MQGRKFYFNTPDYVKYYKEYEMWDESKTSNVWAWIVSVLFLVFVVTGVVVK